MERTSNNDIYEVVDYKNVILESRTITFLYYKNSTALKYQVNTWDYLKNIQELF